MNSRHSQRSNLKIIHFHRDFHYCLLRSGESLQTMLPSFWPDSSGRTCCLYCSKQPHRVGHVVNSHSYTMRGLIPKIDERRKSKLATAHLMQSGGRRKLGSEYSQAPSRREGLLRSWPRLPRRRSRACTLIPIQVSLRFGGCQFPPLRPIRLHPRRLSFPGCGRHSPSPICADSQNASLDILGWAAPANTGMLEGLDGSIESVTFVN